VRWSLYFVSKWNAGKMKMGWEPKAVTVMTNRKCPNEG